MIMNSYFKTTAIIVLCMILTIGSTFSTIDPAIQNSTNATNFLSDNKAIVLLVNGKKIQIQGQLKDVEAQHVPIFDSKTKEVMVSTDLLTEYFGIKVKIESKTKQIILSKGNLTATTILGSNFLKLSKKTINMKTTSKVVSGKVYLPLKLVAENILGINYSINRNLVYMSSLKASLSEDQIQVMIELLSGKLQMVKKTFETENGMVEIEQRSVLSDKVTLLIPKDYKEMSAEAAKIKYPQERRPTYILTNSEGSINVAFSKTISEATENDITEYAAYFKELFSNLYPSATWYSSGIEIINGKNIGKIELLTPAVDGNIYNLVLFAELEGKLLLVSFNCTEKYMKDWQPIANDIMKSIVVE